MSRLKVEIDMVYVKKELDKNNNVKTIAEELKINKNTLYDRIKQVLGIDYEIDSRVKEKEIALKQTKELILQGYTNKRVAKEINKSLYSIGKYRELLIARGELEKFKTSKTIIEEIKKEVEKKVECEEIQKEVRKEIKIDYNGWRYKMCKTWGLVI